MTVQKSMVILFRSNFKVLRRFSRNSCFIANVKDKSGWWSLSAGARNYSQDSENIIKSPLGEVQFTSLLFHEYLTLNWSLWENKTATECGVTRRRYSFKKVLRHSKSLAAALQNKFGLKKGNVLAIVLNNCPEYPIIVLANSQIGVISTTVNPAYTVDEIKTQLEDSGARFIITEPQYYDKCVEIMKVMKTTFPILIVKTTPKAVIPEGGILLTELFNPSLAGELKHVDIKPEDTLFLPYSSGTTGSPKGVILTHKNVVSNLTQISHPETVIMNPTTRFHQDTVLGVLPMFHIYGLVIITLFPLKEGCRVLCLPRFSPLPFLTNVVRKKVNILYVVPALFLFLAHNKVRPRYLKHVQYIVNAAAPIPTATAYAVLKKSEHVKIAQGYGMTESSPALAHTCSRRMQKLTSIGTPIASTKFKIQDLETGKALPMHQNGELCAWGPQVMKGYLNKPEDTAFTVDQDGWLKTGDVGYYDEDFDFFIVERLKDLIKVKGFQVAPAELENKLREHPSIEDAVVVGVKNPDYGEVPRAFVIVKEGANVTEEEVKEFIAQKLSRHKHLLGGVKFVKEFPKNNLGKVLRKELRNEK